MPATIRFTPVSNGVDYLISVVQHLGKEAAEVDHRDLKYGVLHLHAATEVLLKARLTQEHWSQVLENPSAAHLGKFRSGDFRSCSMDTAIKRLNDVAEVQIESGSQSAISSLSMTRNALQHYSLERSAAAVEANAATVLSFLITFIDNHLRPELSDDELWDVEPQMTKVRDGLAQIQGFVKKRMNEIRHELERHPERTVECPTCRKLALVVGSPQARCLFCTTRMSWEEAAIGYVDIVLQRPWRQLPSTSGFFSQPAQPPVDTCRNCHQVALVTEAPTAAESEGIDLCFHCAQAAPSAAS
ncbi:hypothetical protein [Streptomyces agglomeratus]|uniref:hypothetical protein n=1 Tax=Streptomyces agglomeratus TaxID=285458 RepID=UPI0008542F48|nr:hypothetical protein [Streptomyces agglomeratus]OEJ49529.1 hypothetical protein BGK72_00545 [Streptomyces agglomeratus]